MCPLAESDFFPHISTLSSYGCLANTRIHISPFSVLSMQQTELCVTINRHASPYLALPYPWLLSPSMCPCNVCWHHGRVTPFSRLQHVLGSRDQDFRTCYKPLPTLPVWDTDSALFLLRSGTCLGEMCNRASSGYTKYAQECVSTFHPRPPAPRDRYALPAVGVDVGRRRLPLAWGEYLRPEQPLLWFFRNV